MTERLYYNDAYLTRFTARVVEQFTYQDHPAVVLDRTAFYPTSGGQPFDQGVLGDVPVIDVLVRETDDAVIHLLEAPLADQPTYKANQVPDILGEIEWERRFDHMQHHTGQHILSQAFVQVAQAETVSFHLGTESVTIDLDGLWQSQPTDTASSSVQRRIAEWMEQVELLANKIVWKNQPVTTQIVHPDELSSVPLRKPPAVTGDVRVVQVADFDWSACGGTHVGHTGEVGMIKIVKWERRGSETRVEFRCGRRALDDYGHKSNMIQHVAAGFNVGYWELDQAVERLRAEVKDTRSRLRQAERALSHYEAAEWRATAPNVAGVRLVVRNLAGRSSADMRALAQQLVSEPGVVALLGLVDTQSSDGSDQKAQFCFARSSDVKVDMVSLVQDTAGTLGARRGGGKPDFAQGGGTLTHKEQMDDVLDWAVRKLRQQLK